MLPCNITQPERTFRILAILYLSLSTLSVNGISKFACEEEKSACCCSKEVSLPLVPLNDNCCCEMKEVPPSDAMKFQVQEMRDNLTCLMTLPVQSSSEAFKHEPYTCTEIQITTRLTDICIVNSNLRI